VCLTLPIARALQSGWLPACTLGDDVTIGHKFFVCMAAVSQPVLVGMGSIVIGRRAVVRGRGDHRRRQPVPPAQRTLESGFLYMGSPRARCGPP